LSHQQAVEAEVKELSAKLVDRDWLVKSGFQAQIEAQGYNLRWSRPDAIPTRELDGYEVLLEVDQTAQTRCSLTRYDGSILIGKKA